MAERIEGERLYVAQFMKLTFPLGNYALNVPLGPIPEGLAREVGRERAIRMFRPSRRRIDATAWEPRRYILVEAKLRDPFAALGQLATYEIDARNTEDLINYRGQPFVKWTVAPFFLEGLALTAGELGIEVHEFAPAWLEKYYEGYQKYFTREYREARDRKQRDRRLLGLE